MEILSTIVDISQWLPKNIFQLRYPIQPNPLPYLPRDHNSDVRRAVKHPLAPHQEALLREYDRLRAYFVHSWRMQHLEPDDLVQEVYVRLLANKDLSTVEDPRGFIFRQAQFVGKTEIPQRDREWATVSIDGESSDSIEPYDDLIEAPPDNYAERAELIRLIDELEPHLTRVVRLHYLDGLTIAQISIITGIKRDALKKQLQKALVTLRKRYNVSVLKPR